MDGELVGSVRSRAERSGRKASHPSRTAVGKSTQPCKASRRAFAWLEKGNCEGRRQQDKGTHHDTRGGRSRASHLYGTSPGCQAVLLGYRLPDGLVRPQKRAAAVATNEFRLGGLFYLPQAREPGASLPKLVPRAGLGALFSLGGIVPEMN